MPSTTKPHRTAKGFRLLTGDKEIDAALAKIGEPARANRIARAGLTKAVRVILKAVKAEVPSKHKSVKKALGGRIKKNKRKGVVEAKVGAGVGKQKEQKSDRSGKEGVGIGFRNVHWYVMGTKERRPYKKKVMKTAPTAAFPDGRFMGKRVGPMPAHPIVKDGYAKSKESAMHALREGCKNALLQEVHKAAFKVARRKLS